MISYIRGVLAEKSPTRAVIEAAGVGYELLIPISTYEKLPREGADAKLLAYHCVREDDESLFGFATANERELFVKLTGVSGVGPKIALAILSGASVGELALAIASGDAKRLAAVKGVGKKTAAKICVELRDKVDALAFADAPFFAVSDGQRQRILLARALCQQPQLIVLDEPTSFLDIRYKLELLSVLKRMVRENDLAVLLSLHELDLARRISDTVICVAGDRIDRIGTPEEIFTSDYIAQLYHLERGKYDECFSTLEFVP